MSGHIFLVSQVVQCSSGCITQAHSVAPTTTSCKVWTCVWHWLVYDLFRSLLLINFCRYHSDPVEWPGVLTSCCRLACKIPAIVTGVFVNPNCICLKWYNPKVEANVVGYMVVAVLRSLLCLRNHLHMQFQGQKYFVHRSCIFRSSSYRRGTHPYDLSWPEDKCEIVSPRHPTEKERA